MEILYIVLAIIIVLIVFTIIYNIWDNRRVSITRITRSIGTKDGSKEDKEISICHISDLHDCNDYGKDQKVIDIIKKNNPDIVLCTGDFMDFYKNELDFSISFMKRLAEVVPGNKIYYIVGNHEARMKMCSSKEKNEMVAKFWQEIQNLGIHYLKDEKDEIEVNGVKLRIMGFKDFQEHYPNFIKKGTKYEHLIGNDKRPLPVIIMSKDRYTELNIVILNESMKAIENPEDENITLLLAHRAEYVDAYGELRKC